MKVSVLMITYNHERYISQAVNSALMQNTDFDYEIVIGEDSSTDRTRMLLINLQKHYPDIINLQLRDKNIGMISNLISTYKSCKGEYIALLEGDDYWTDPQKLQKQVEFLDKNDDYVMCFHDVTVSDEDGKNYAWSHFRERKEFYSIDDLLEGNFIPTSSILFRNGLIKEYPDWFYETYLGDWSLGILLAKFGLFKSIDQVMGVYRAHSGGAWTSQSRIDVLRKTIQTADCFAQDLSEQQKKILSTSLLTWNLEIISILKTDRKLEEASSVAKRVLSEFGLRRLLRHYLNANFLI